MAVLFPIHGSRWTANPAERSIDAGPIPEQDVGGKDNKRSDELRIRASNLELAGLEGVRPVAKLSPALVMFGAPHNRAARLTLWRWISCQAADKTRFQASWSDLAGSNGNYYRVRNIFSDAFRQRRKWFAYRVDEAGKDALRNGIPVRHWKSQTASR